MKTTKNWLAHLKVGDKVIYHGSFQKWSVHVITRETATRWYFRVNDHAEVWIHKETGLGPRSAGSSGRSYIEPYSTEMVRELQMYAFKRTVSASINYRVAAAISDDAWRAFYKAYLEAMKEDDKRQRKTL